MGGISDLKTAYEENNEEIKFVLLINCGGTIDLVDILQPEEDVVLFVLDSHKPSDVCNVYSDGQVRLVWKDSDEGVPNFDDIFRDDEEEESDNEVSAAGEEGREAVAAGVLKRRERRAWEENRNRLMFEYTQFSYYGKSSACVALELAWRLSRASVCSVWAAAVGCCSQLALAQRAPAVTLLDADSLQHHVARIAHENKEQPQAASVTLEKDAWLPLYRSWSVESALRHAPNSSPHLKLWTLRGDAKLRQLLADMGFPLSQARQAYRSMDVELRRELLGALEASGSKHGLPQPTRASFLLKRAFTPHIAALDLVYIILALIEDDLPQAENFQRALSVLGTESGTSGAVLAQGVAAAQRRLGAVARAVHATLSARALHCAGPFNYIIIQEGTPEASTLGRPLWLGVAARWCAEAGGSGGSTRPLLASAPLLGRPDSCLLIGVPPKHVEEPRNLFGKAFEQAALQCGCSVNLDYFDSSIVALPTHQRTQFLDALTVLLS